MKKPKIKRLICVLCILMACLTVAPIRALAASAVLTDEEVLQRIEARVESNRSEITVMSFNVAGAQGDTLEDYAGIRAQAMAEEIIAQVLPDSFGTQEMNSICESHFEDLLPFYDYYGVVRGGDSGDARYRSEKNTIFWLKDKYTAVDMGTFWLSLTPDVESRYDGAGCHRICTWVLLEDINTGMRYLHMNTHLDNASGDARNYGAQVIVDKLAEILEAYPDVPVVLTGDFNSSAGSTPYSTLTGAGFADLYVTAELGENVRTFHNWGSYEVNSGSAIDFIFAQNIESASVCRVMTEMDTSISDHYPVMAVIDFGEDAIPETPPEEEETEPSTEPEESTTQPPEGEDESDTTTEPEESTTVTPEESTTVTPEESTTVTPEESTTVTPEESTTVTPEESTTVTPEESTTVTPETSTTSTASGETTAADETATAAADSSSASSQQTSPATGASGTAALTAAMFSAAAALFVISRKRLAA